MLTSICGGSFIDDVPDQFTLNAVNGAVLNTVISSNTITVSGINVAVPISCSAGTFTVNGGAEIVSGTVVAGDQVVMKLTSSANYLTVVSGVLNINGVTNTFDVTTTTQSAFRYLMLKISETNGDAFAALYTVDWLVGATVYPVQTMTSNTTPSPLVASGNSVYSASFNQFKVFDKNIGTYWAGASTWHAVQGPMTVILDLGAGNQISPTGIGIAPYSGTTYNPKTFQCLGSNTGAFAGEEVVLYSATGLTTGWIASSRRDFTF